MPRNFLPSLTTALNRTSFFCAVCFQLEKAIAAPRGPNNIFATMAPPTTFPVIAERYRRPSIRLITVASPGGSSWGSR
jgi:hypothetical protein